MGSQFLENLKKAVDDGNFNSEAAKKINEVHKLADIIAPTGGAASLLEKRLGETVIKTVSNEKLVEVNSEYEKKMQEFKKQDLILQQIKILNEIDETIMLSIGDMHEFIKALESEFDINQPEHNALFSEIEKIKVKYSSINN